MRRGHAAERAEVLSGGKTQAPSGQKAASLARQKTLVQGPVDTADAALMNGRRLTQLAEQGGYRSRLTRPACYGQPVARGRFECVEYPAGLSVHICDMEELADTATCAELSPGVSFLLLQRGELGFQLNGRRFELSCDAGPCCVALILDSITHWQRELRRGCKLTKVQVTVAPDWLAQHCPDTALRIWSLSLSKSQILPSWRPSVRALSAAREMLATLDPSNDLQRLHIENQALSLVAECLGELECWRKNPAGGSRRAQRIAEVCQFLDAHLDLSLNLAAIGKMFGMSTSTLQRCFKEMTGMPVGDYIRSQRLERAREQLLAGGVSVTEAAYAAGYNHPTNFIAAYRRRYGCSPGSERGV